MRSGVNLFSLFADHLVQYRHDPVFKLAVVVVRCEQVSNAVDSSIAELAARQMEITDVRGRQTFDKVFLHTAGCGYYAVHLDIVIRYGQWCTKCFIFILWDIKPYSINQTSASTLHNAVCIRMKLSLDETSIRFSFTMQWSTVCSVTISNFLSSSSKMVPTADTSK